MEKVDILIAGIGGQGIVAASDIIAATGILAGYDVKKTDSLGMAQRGGSVVSHIRMADSVSSPLIPTGAADVLVALEKLEAVRWAEYLRQDGTAVINDLAVSPPDVNLGFETYPANHEITAVVKKYTTNVFFIPGNRLAEEAGIAKALNSVILGCMACFLPFRIPFWKDSMRARLPASTIDLNLKAFDRGREYIFKLVGRSYNV